MRVYQPYEHLLGVFRKLHDNASCLLEEFLQLQTQTCLLQAICIRLFVIGNLRGFQATLQPLSPEGEHFPPLVTGRKEIMHGWCKCTPPFTWGHLL